MSITVDVDASGFTRYLQAAIESASPTETRKYLKNAGMVILRMEAGIFKSDGADLGARWRPLSAATVAMRKKRHNLKGKRASGMQILRDTRTLEYSVSHGSAERGPTGALRELRPLEIKIGSSLKYAATHQYGRPAMTIPNTKVKGYTRKIKGGKRGVSQRIAFVKPHTRTQHWGAVPPRPFVGWTPRGIDMAVAEAYRHFCEAPDQRTR